ncbi:hypothetical protein K1719_023776 [Acacia pycnantha]|nr:hypothetical protein K1719_023776 [Acacia pycnantha]
MYRTAFRNLSFCARYLLLHRLNHNPNHALPLFSSSAHSIAPRFFSSTNNLSNQVSSTQAHTREKEDPSLSEDVISNAELKKRISKLEEGDTEAIPEIFEGILSRMLAGKPEEAQNELRKELLGERTESDEEETESADNSEDIEFDLDDEMSGTDEK